MAKHIGPEQKPVHAWSFGGLPELKRLAEQAGFTVLRLEKLEHPALFASVQRLVDVWIACAGRTDEDGKLAMGLVDLDEERWLPAIGAFSADAHAALAPYADSDTLVVPFPSDEISAQA